MEKYRSIKRLLIQAAAVILTSSSFLAVHADMIVPPTTISSADATLVTPSPSTTGDVSGATTVTPAVVDSVVPPTADGNIDATVITPPPMTTGDTSGATVVTSTVVVPVTQGSNDAEASTSIPTVRGSNSDEASSSIPVIQGSNNDSGSSTSATTLTPPTTGGTSGATTVTLPPTTGGTNGATIVTPIVATVSVVPTVTSGGGNSVASGFGGSSFSGGGSIVGADTLATALPTAPDFIATCDLLTTPLHINHTDDPTQMSLLQVLLNKLSGANLVVNGIFDRTTFNAVENFQTRYATDVLSPWGATAPSGYVYITTMKKLNELNCNSTRPLTTADLAIIAAYKAQVATTAQAQGAAFTPQPTTANPAVSTTSVATSTVPIEVGAVVTNPNAAAAVNSGTGNFFGNVGSFFSNFFHRIF